MKPEEVVVVGYGGRGKTYAKYALRRPDELKIVAVAEPDEKKREEARAVFALPPERCYSSWEDLYAEKQLAPTLLNCTQDRMHFASSMAAFRAGYDVMLEKPLAPTPEETIQLVTKAEETGRRLLICHVLRHTPFYGLLHELICSGRLGEVITVEHKENVAFWHMAAGFVRGPWCNEAASSPMLLAKCCHDLDILCWNIGRRPVRVSSFGSLTYFRRERAPHPEVPEFCADGCPAEHRCPYSSLRKRPLGRASTIWNAENMAEAEKLLAQQKKHSRGYGRCVFRCDNDVVDHQVVNVEFEGGATLSFTMHGHSHEGARTMRYSGTAATLRGKDDTDLVSHEYLSGRSETHVWGKNGDGHGGGDTGIMRDLVRFLRDPRAEVPFAPARESLTSHLLVFAAERARKTGTVVAYEEFEKEMFQRAKETGA